MKLDQVMTRTFLDQALRTQAGRTHVLNQVAEAEASSEGDIFDRLLARVDDPELQRMIRRHQQDEILHAQLFRERLVAHGGTPHPVPTEIRIIDRIDRALGGFMNDPITDDAGVMRAYLVLQVLEERAVTQFPVFEAAFRRAGDELTAEVFARIKRDEERHLKYCHAVSRRYAPEPALLERTLAHYREVEGGAFAENSRANMRYMLALGYLDVGPAGTVAWLGVASLMDRLKLKRPTPFGGRAAVAGGPAQVSLAAA